MWSDAAMHARLRSARRLVLVGALVGASGALFGQPAAGRTTRRAVAPRQAGTAQACPWLNEALPVLQRVSMVLSRMSLGQKIAEMEIEAGGTTGPGAGYEGYVPAQPALCIPDLVEQDGSLGVGGGLTGVTQLPSEIALASAWNPSLARSYGVVNGIEHRDKGIAMALGPGLNIQRDPRWGRNFEMFSEDPLLTSRLGVAYIEGLQSQRVMADVKHFAPYNEETDRSTGQDAIVGTRALHEIYLPPFYAVAVQAKAASFMCSYPMLNGQWSCQDQRLLTSILDNRWGYPGFIRSDNGANHSTVASANAGLDQERGSGYWTDGQLAAAVADGLVRRATITDAVRRILTQMFDFDLFNDPPTGTLSTPATSPADVAVAGDVAAQGTVLLQNTDHVLPLSAATTTSIAVIGPDGTSAPLTAGGGSSHVTPPYVISPLSAITASAGPGASIDSYSGTDPTLAAQIAAQAQVAIVFASQFESEGTDLQSLSLPADENALIESVAAANPHTIVVLNTGGPVLMPWLNQVKGVLEAWYPGQQDGAALASELFGVTDPGGHLPETFPARLSQLPTAAPSRFPGVDGRVDYSEGLDVGYRYYDARHETPLFPFGYGLSYTSFRFSQLQITRTTLTNTESGPGNAAGQGARLFTVRARITNTGAVAGSDVAQLYLGDPSAAGEPPRQLEGFRRIELAPAQSAEISFPVSGHELSYFSVRANGWTVPRGRFTVYVGDSSALSSLPLVGHVPVTGTLGGRYANLFAPPSVNPGSTFSATVRLINHGNIPIATGTVHLGLPRGWTLVQSPTASVTVGPGHAATRRYIVTAPIAAQGTTGTLTATLDSPGPDDAGDLSATARVTVAAGVTLAPAAATILNPGQTAAVTFTATSHLPHAAVFDLAPAAPAGYVVQPPASTTLGADASASLAVTVSAPAQATLGPRSIALNPSFGLGGVRYRLAPAALGLVIANPEPPG